MTPMWVSILTTVCIRVPLAYALAYFTRSETLVNGAPESMFISLLVSWCLGAIITTLIYRKGNWKNKALD
jgi:Na+-driven multidrug efflux pump